MTRTSSNFHLSSLSSVSPLRITKFSTTLTLLFNNSTFSGKKGIQSRGKKISMASTSAISAVIPLTSAAQKRLPASSAFFRPVPVRPAKAAVVGSRTAGKFQVRASMKEKVVTGLTAAALTASMVIPEVAEAAGPGITPSLKNFLLSIAAGGIVLGVLVGAVIGVANFDPVQRS